MKRILCHVIPCGVSAVAAALLLLLVDGTTAASKPATVPQVSEATHRSATSTAHHHAKLALGRRLQRIEGRLNHVEAAPRAGAPADDADDASQRPMPTRRQTEQAWQAKLDAHAADARDASWADAAESAFGADLSVLAGSHGFEYRDTDCRTTTCAADLAFTSYDAALSAQGALLHHPYATNCTRTILLPEPADTSARYVATVMYTCAAGSDQ